MRKKPKAFTFYIQVFGCQMNHIDAEIIVSTLAERGGQPLELPAKADIIIAVSCGVRAAAEERIISWLKKMRRQNKNAKIILTGCLSHRPDVKERLGEAVNYFIPIENWITEIEEIIPQSGCLSPDFYRHPGARQSDFQAYLPVTTGCNNFCSYCVVPYARGREKSIAPEQIIDEAKSLAKKGYKEIYLLGQNVNSYQGIDRKGREWNFSRLLRAIDKIPGKFWIRFISSHPKDISQEFIETVAGCKKVSPNLHLPIQSGSNRVLRLMNRHYTREDYLKLIAKIKKGYPGIVFSTDIIVGFPGETDRDFQESLQVVEKVGYEMLFSLKYSPRPQTAAFKLKDSVPAPVKIVRQRELDAVWKKIALEKNRRFIGKTITILVDRVKIKIGPNGQAKTYVLGKSFENKDVQAELNPRFKKDIVGKWAEILVKDASALALQGEMVRAEK